jgi:hypothetical protein
MAKCKRTCTADLTTIQTVLAVTGADATRTQKLSASFRRRVAAIA